MSKIQFKIWETPFATGDLQLIDLHWGDGSVDIQFEEGKRFFEEPNPLFKGIELQVQVLNITTESIFNVNFASVSAFRFLDEHGLLEIWDARDSQNVDITNTFKVKNHLWSKESPLSFAMADSDDWSHLISTGNECLEVVCGETPKIELSRQIKFS